MYNLDDGTYNINKKDASNNIFNFPTAINIVVGTEYLISVRYHDTAGRKIDVYVDDGTTVQSELNIDASVLAGGFNESVLYVGMRTLTSSTYYNIAFKSIVLASGSDNFDSIKTALAI